MIGILAQWNALSVHCWQRNAIKGGATLRCRSKDLGAPSIPGPTPHALHAFIVHFLAGGVNPDIKKVEDNPPTTVISRAGRASGGVSTNQSYKHLKTAWLTLPVSIARL
jgi:hypothetical protein